MKIILIAFLLNTVAACSLTEGTTPLGQSTTPTLTPMRPETRLVTNSIGMDLLAIPAGSFLMGASANDPGAYSSEKPQHQVSIDPELVFFIFLPPFTLRSGLADLMERVLEMATADQLSEFFSVGLYPLCISPSFAGVHPVHISLFVYNAGRQRSHFCRIVH